jgi:uncharacterized protein (DUF1501 family)
MNAQHLNLARRRFLGRGLAGTAAAFGAGSLANLLLATRPAFAADYKALVCVFLYGGNDGMNMITPSDAARHAQYAGVRGALALPQANLVALSGVNYGLHPAMTALQPAWTAGQLAPVFNVGPLAKPLTKAQFRNLPSSDPAIPDNLFSHSDQQILWETGSADSLTRTGWGGRASDTLQTANPVISVGGNGRFGLSALQAPLVLPAPGSFFGAHGFSANDLKWAPNAARKNALDALYAQAAADAAGNDMIDGYSRQQRDAFEVSARLGGVVEALPGDALSASGIDAAFKSLTVDRKIANPLARQLYQVAKLVANNATVRGNRQIFFAQLGGFDTHGQQIGADAVSGHHAGLMKTLADALAAFNTAMNNLGLGPQVTSFTQSDFGRTLKPNNSSGTDHAWGNQHLVLGGAVKGGATYGRYPELVLGGVDDVGVDAWELQGRWIPSTSVDQYAATLLRWFGANEGQLDQVLPNLVNFGTARGLGFV